VEEPAAEEDGHQAAVVAWVVGWAEAVVAPVAEAQATPALAEDDQLAEQAVRPVAHAAEETRAGLRVAVVLPPEVVLQAVEIRDSIGLRISTIRITSRG
jgi:hypothetical protein